jgi:hypothetical protein
MNDINKHCDENVGGILHFNFIPVRDVLSIVEPIKQRITEPITLKPGTRWFEFYATRGTINFDENQQESPHGDYYKAKFTGLVPKGRTEIEDTFNKMKNKNFILDYTDNNGHRRLVGTVSNPLRFKSDYSTGNDAKNKNGHSFEFFGNIIDKSPTYFI